MTAKTTPSALHYLVDNFNEDQVFTIYTILSK